VVQAGAGAHVFESDPAFAKQALRNIEQRGRAAMGELDRIIAQLRGDAPETRAPLPGLGDLAGLIDGSRAAGMTIDAALAAPSVAPAVGRATFGIVREALTNAAKHAPGVPVTVTVAEDGDALAIRVANAAGGRPLDDAQSYGRHGVAGMRDRVGLLGGASRIGPTADGGFEVLALIPLGASLAHTSEPTSPWSELRETVAS
jgi:signal transduction histidine kinase